MFYSSRRRNSGASSFLIDSGYFREECRGLPGCRSAAVQNSRTFASMPGLAPAGDLLFFASPKKPKEKKGDPQSGSLRFASGNLRCSKAAEFLETSRPCRRRTSKNLFPLPSALLSPARTGFWEKLGVGFGGSPHPCRLPAGEEGSANPSPNPSPQPVLAGLEKVESDGLKNLDVRRLRSRLVSKFSGTFNFFKEPQSGPGCGSPFLCSLSFGEAKESELPPGNPRHSSPSTRSKKRVQWQQEDTK